MTRVTSGASSHSRHKKIIKSAKGYFGRRKNTFRAANQAVEKAGQYSYRDRKKEKEIFDLYGFKELMLLPGYMVLTMLVL